MKTADLLLISLLFSPVVLAQKDGKTTWIDPIKAAQEDPDFSIQGEYGRDGLDFGVQVVALGDGKFEAYILEGGLPGEGWEKGKGRVKLSGQRRDHEVKIAPEGKWELHRDVQFDPNGKWGLSLIDQTLILTVHGNAALQLAKRKRQSPTLGAKAPEGAVVLFDGSDTDQWKNGKMKDGLLLASGALSKDAFGDCQLHLEFRTPYKPDARGQKRGNSGVYYGGRWETQVLDSFALEGRMNECGGIYSIAAPALNMCLPPLTWQTYDVDFTAAKFDSEGNRTAWPRMTVKLNGVVIHDDQELSKPFTTSAPLTGPLKDEALPIFLQDHGNPVVFRNIWALPKK